MIITKQYLNEHLTKSGAITKAQLEALGLSWPPISGWRKRLIGKELAPQKQELFEEGKHVYTKATLKKKAKQKRREEPTLVEQRRVSMKNRVLKEMKKDPELAKEIIDQYLDEEQLANDVFTGSYM